MDEEASTEEVIIIQEEQQFEPKKVKPEVKPVVAKIELPVESKKVCIFTNASTFKTENVPALEILSHLNVCLN